MIVQPVELAGEHVVLEPLRAEHVDELCDVASEPELWQWTVSAVRERADLAVYVEDALRQQQAGQALPFIVRDAATRGAIGSTRFGNIDIANRRAEIGWTWIGAAWRRTAANTEAKYLLLSHAFETWRCIRVEFKTDVLNVRSRAALRRIGAVEEGVLRAHMVTASGRIRDTVYFSILEAEWPRVRHDLERKLGRT